MIMDFHLLLRCTIFGWTILTMNFHAEADTSPSNGDISIPNLVAANTTSLTVRWSLQYSNVNLTISPNDGPLQLPVVFTNAGENTYNFTGLKPGQQYLVVVQYYKLTMSNLFYTQPLPPISISAQFGDGRLTVSFRANPNSSQLFYGITYAQDGYHFKKIFVTQYIPPVLEYACQEPFVLNGSGLRPETLYTVQVMALAADNSTISDPLSLDVLLAQSGNNYNLQCSNSTATATVNVTSLKLVTPTCYPIDGIVITSGTPPAPECVFPVDAFDPEANFTRDPPSNFNTSATTSGRTYSINETTTTPWYYNKGTTVTVYANVTVGYASSNTSNNNSNDSNSNATSGMSSANSTHPTGPQFDSFFPSFGPFAGETVITIKGRHLLVANDVVVGIGIYPCVIMSINDFCIIAATPARDQRATYANGQLVQPVVVVYDGNTVISTGWNFTYMPDPVIYAVSPNTSIVSGGIQWLVTGDHLTSVAQPVMNFIVVNASATSAVLTQPCVMQEYNPSAILCPTPDVSKYEQTLTPSNSSGILNNPRLQFYIGFHLDGVAAYRDLRASPIPQTAPVEIYVDPIIYTEDTQTFTPLTQYSLTIKGQFLTGGCFVNDYIVHIESWAVMPSYLDSTTLVFNPPDTPPATYNGDMSDMVEGQQRVWVEVGFKKVFVYRVVYDNAPLVIILPVVIIGAVIIIVIIILVAVCCCCSGRSRERKGRRDSDHRAETGDYNDAYYPSQNNSHLEMA